MKIVKWIHSGLPMLLGFALALPVVAEDQSKYLCSEPNPESICATNTCGSAAVPCTVDVKRTASSVSITPDFPNAKSNAPFCVKAGTTMAWKSISKNTGFLVDFGTAPPFDPPDAIIGGSDRTRSVVPTKKGCYKFSAGACVSGGTYGMCQTVDSELIVTGSN
jgi:hypothetical protein